MTTSGTYAFSPTLVDLVLDAFERVKIRPGQITPDHMFSVQRSMNFVLVGWANRGFNLWAMEEVTTTLIDSQQSYTLAAQTVALGEVWVRSYQLADTESVAVAFATTNLSPTVTITWADHGLVAGRWVSIPIPVAIGGLIVQGFYQVVSVPTTGTFTITHSSNATSTASGGAVPSYGTVASDATITVTLTAHGMVAGETWTVHEQVEVGGLTLLGDYEITSVTTNTLTFEATSAAGSTDSASENDGEVQLAAQDAAANPRDHFLTPISRTEWAMIPEKTREADRPSQYWFDRQRDTPVLRLWPVPSLTAPQELHFFRMRQLQDATPQGTETPDIPYRFEKAFCAELAADLAVKYDKEDLEVLTTLADKAWMEASGEDRERVSLHIQPQLQDYFR